MTLHSTGIMSKKFFGGFGGGPEHTESVPSTKVTDPKPLSKWAEMSGILPSIEQITPLAVVALAIGTLGIESNELNNLAQQNELASLVLNNPNIDVNKLLEGRPGCTPALPKAESQPNPEDPIKPGIYAKEVNGAEITAEIQQAVKEAGMGQFDKLMGISAVSEDPAQQPVAFHIGTTKDGHNLVLFSTEKGYIIRPYSVFVTVDEDSQVHYSYSIFEKSKDETVAISFLDFGLDLTDTQVEELNQDQIRELTQEQINNPEKIESVTVENPFDGKPPVEFELGESNKENILVKFLKSLGVQSALAAGNDESQVDPRLGTPTVEPVKPTQEPEVKPSEPPVVEPSQEPQPTPSPEIVVNPIDSFKTSTSFAEYLGLNGIENAEEVSITLVEGKDNQVISATVIKDDKPVTQYFFIRQLKDSSGKTEFLFYALDNNIEIETFSTAAIEYSIGSEYKKAVQDYLEAMGLPADAVAIRQVQKEINGEQIDFLEVEPKLDKLTPLQQEYMDLYGNIRVFVWDKEMESWRMYTEADFFKTHKTEFGYAAGHYKDDTTRLVLDNVPLWVSDWELHWNTTNPPLRPSIDKFDFSIGDSMISTSINAEKRIQIHHLLFGNKSTLPQWLLDINDTNMLTNIIKDHAQTVVSHYREYIFDSLRIKYPELDEKQLTDLYRTQFAPQYTAVNEFIPLPWAQDTFWTTQFNNGTDFFHIKPNSTSWLENIDTTPIETVFNTANVADPDATLIYNEAGIESSNGDPLYDIPGYKTRSDMTYELVKHLLDKNVPIHGIGLQMHLYGKDFTSQEDIDEWAIGVRENIQRYKELGLKVFITEMDVRMSELASLPKFEQSLIQARIYRSIIQILIEEGVDSISIFGVLDKHSWLENSIIAGENASSNNPLIYNDDGKSKPARFAIWSSQK